MFLFKGWFGILFEKCFRDSQRCFKGYPMFPDPVDVENCKAIALS